MIVLGGLCAVCWVGVVCGVCRGVRGALGWGCRPTIFGELERCTYYYVAPIGRIGDEWRFWLRL